MQRGLVSAGRTPNCRINPRVSQFPQLSMNFPFFTRSCGYTLGMETAISIPIDLFDA
jgi:hypothetical protein